MAISKIIVYIFYYWFARYLPISYKPYSCGVKFVRYLCGKCLFKKCGVGVNIEHGADFGTGSRVEIGDYSGIGVHSRIGDVKIGSYVMMGPEVNIITNNHKYQDLTIPMCFQGFEEINPVTIEDDVWIGARAVILPGVKIGKGAIIGANTVVTKDVDDYAIFCGNPGKVVRYRTQRSMTDN